MIWYRHRSMSLGSLMVCLLSCFLPVVLGQAARDPLSDGTIPGGVSRATRQVSAPDGSLHRLARDTVQAIATCRRAFDSQSSGVAHQRGLEPPLGDLAERIAVLQDRCVALLSAGDETVWPEADRSRRGPPLRDRLAIWRNDVQELLMELRAAKEPDTARRLLDALREKVVSVVHSGATIPSSAKEGLPASRQPRSLSSLAADTPREDVRQMHGAGDTLRTVQDVPILSPQESSLAVLTLYQRIRNGLRYEPYYGSRKGAATIAEGGGNDFDMAAAFVKGLREIHIDAQYVYGTVDIRAEDIMNWVGGADTPEVALTILRKSGIPAEGLPKAGPYTTIRVEHLWVEAYLPSDTTGAAPSIPSETEATPEWRALDPSFKLCKDTPGIVWDEFISRHPVDPFLPVESMNLSLSGDCASGLEGTLLGEELLRRSDALKAYMEEQGHPNPKLGDVLGSREIIPGTSSGLPISLPYEVVSVLWRSEEIPDVFRDVMTITWYASPDDENPSLNCRLYLDEIDDEVLSLHYRGETDYDVKQLATFDGSNYRPYVTVRPILQLGPQILGTSSKGDWMGGRERLAVTYSFANGLVSTYDVDTFAGNYYVFGFDLGRIPVGRIERRMADLRMALDHQTDTASYTALFCPEIVGNVLALLGDAYYSQTSTMLDQQAILERVIRVNQVTQGLFEWTLDASYLFSIPIDVEGFGKPCIDLCRAFQASSVTSAAGDAEAEQVFSMVSGPTLSYMEGQIIEQVFGHPGISTMHIFKLANDAGMKIHVVDASNLNDKLLELDHPLTVTHMISDEVGHGKLVVIPEGEVSLADWRGTGMAVIDPMNGEGVFWIYNYLAAGGSSALDCPLGSTQQFLLETISPVSKSPPYLGMGVWLTAAGALASLGQPELAVVAVGLAAWAGYNQFSSLGHGLYDPILAAFDKVNRGVGATASILLAPRYAETTDAREDRVKHLLNQMMLSETLETQSRYLVHQASGLSRPDPHALRPVRDYLIEAVVDNGDQFSHFLERFQSAYGGEILSSLRSSLSDEQLVELAVDCVDFRSLCRLKTFLQAFPDGPAFFKALVSRACSGPGIAVVSQIRRWPETVRDAFADWLAVEYPDRMGIPQSDWMVHNARQLGDKAMRSTSGVALDANGVVYLTDSGSDSVGSLFDQWPRYGVTFTFGGPGVEPKAFKAPHGVVVSSAGTIYVADTGNHRIQVFDTIGNVLNTVGEPGDAGGQLLAPRGLCLGRNGELYVADTGNHRICVFDPRGILVREFGDYGTDVGHLRRPQGVAVDPQGYVYVADTGNHRIVKFTAEGNWLWSVGSMGSERGGEFISPRGIAIGEDGHLYVCDTYTYRIQEFDTDGAFLGAATNACFQMPANLAFNPTNDSRFVVNDGGRTHVLRDDWKERFYLYGSTAFRQWVDFAYREGRTGFVRIVEFVVTDEVLHPSDFGHYIECVQGEYRFATQDLLYWSFGSTLIHPQIQAEISEALSEDRLILEIRIASAVENPLSPELAALDGATLPAYDWLRGDFLGSVLVDVHVE